MDQPPNSLRKAGNQGREEKGHGEVWQDSQASAIPASLDNRFQPHLQPLSCHPTFIMDARVLHATHSRQPILPRHSHPFCCHRRAKRSTCRAFGRQTSTSGINSGFSGSGLRILEREPGVYSEVLRGQAPAPCMNAQRGPRTSRRPCHVETHPTAWPGPVY